jgi:hypothetical protein
MHHEITKIPFKKKSWDQGAFIGFSHWFFYNYKFNSMEILYFVIFFKKNGCTCTALVGGWEALVPFKQCVHSLLESKSVFSSCRWKRCHVLFLMERQVSPLVVWFCTLSLFSPFFSLPSLKKLQFGSTSVLAIFIFIFWSRSFCRNFIGFRFHYSISIYQKLYYSMWYSFFGFQFFFLALF